MSILSALRRVVRVSLPGESLYNAVVAEARRPAWYIEGAVPDTIDGRFDMVALVLSLVMIRLEDAGAAQLCADLTERFIADMDGSLRQDGVGDQVVGKHIGRMVAALGGRLGAYRDSRTDDVAFAVALRRNLWRGEPVDLAATSLALLTAGTIRPDAKGTRA
jgi:cytochrome b pre-mRNA-processing protein 3